MKIWNVISAHEYDGDILCSAQSYTTLEKAQEALQKQYDEFVRCTAKSNMNEDDWYEATSWINKKNNMCGCYNDDGCTHVEIEETELQ